MKIIKVIASLLIASLLLCNTNLNVKAAEEDTRENISLDYQTCYSATATTAIKIGEGKVSVSSKDDPNIEWATAMAEQEMVTTVDVFARNTPSIESNDAIILPANTQVTLLGASENGWDVIKYENQSYFIWYEYLTNFDNIEDTITTERIYEPSDFKWMGVINWGGYRWTYYSQRVLPGGGLNIPGRHVDEDGFVCDEDGYICLASSDYGRGTIIDTPFGKKGKVYDCGCASGTLDCYCDW